MLHIFINRLTHLVVSRAIDSYQEKDLCDVKDEWLKALERRKNHLNQQMKMITEKDGE